MNNELNNKKKTNPIMIMAIVLSLTSFLLLGIGFYLISTSKLLLLQSFGHLTNSATEIFGNYNNSVITDLLREDKIEVNSKVGVKVNTEELFQFDLSYLEDKQKEKSSFSIDLSQKKQSLLEIDGFLYDDDLYFKIKDIMDYYYTEFSYITLFNQLSNDDYNKIIESFYGSVKEEIKEDDIVKSKEIITIGEKEKKVNKLSYEITSKKITSILSSTVDKILADSELLKSLSKKYNISSDNLKKELNLYKNSLKEINNKSFYYNVYYYGFNNIVMYELDNSNNCIQLYQYDNNYEFLVLEKDRVLFNLDLIKDNKYFIKGTFDKYNYTGNFTIDNDRIYLDLNIKNLMDIRFNQVINNNQVKTEVALMVNGSVLSFDIDTNYKIGKEVTITGLEKAKNINDITQEDIQNILINVQKHPFLSNFYNLLLMYSNPLTNNQVDVLTSPQV